jgi:hypothetical protein
VDGPVAFLWECGWLGRRAGGAPLSPDEYEAIRGDARRFLDAPTDAVIDGRTARFLATACAAAGQTPLGATIHAPRVPVVQLLWHRSAVGADQHRRPAACREC